jgi:opacity protein-like surface antigen
MSMTASYPAPLAVLVAAFLAGAAPAAAQAGHGSGISIYLMAGAQRIDPGALNHDLANRGQPVFGKTYASVGGGANLSLGRFVLGLEGAGLVQDQAESTAFDRTLSGGYALADVGYRVISADRFSLYPLVGVGGGGISFNTRRQGAPTFGQLLGSPDWEARLSSAQMVLQAGVGGDVVLWAGEKHGKPRHVSIGLRAGYTFAPVVGAWRLGSTDVVGGPDVKMQGPFARITIGFGGRVH